MIKTQDKDIGKRHALLALALLTAVGGLLRLVALRHAPPGLHFDEAIYGLLARDIYQGQRPVFFSAYTGREPLYMYFMALLFRFVGINTLGIRLTSALIGAATVPLAYLLFKELFSRRVGLLTAALTALSYWHLTVSRNGYPNILIPPLECLALYFLWRGYRDGRRWQMALGGAFIGSVLYTYLASRLFPVTVALFFIYVLLVDGQRFRRRFWGLALAATVALLVFAPLGYHFLTHPADFWERADQVLAARKAEGGTALGLYADNALQTLGGYFLRGDPRQHYNLPGRPIFDPLMALFFVAGLGVALYHWRAPRYALLPIWVLGMSLPAILTADLMPQGQRSFGVIPAIFGLAALGIDAGWRWLEGRLPPARRAVPALLVGALLLFELGLTAYTYFGVWAQQAATYYIFNADYEALARRAAERLESEDVVVIRSYHYKHPTVAFTEPRTLEAVWTVGGQSFVVPQRPGEEVVYFLPADVRPHPLLQEVAGRLLEPVDEVPAPDGSTAVVIERLRKDALEEFPTPVATFSDALEVLDWQVPERAPRDETLSVLVRWRALRSVDEGHSVTLHLVDENGVTWAQGKTHGYIWEQWQAGDVVYQTFDVSLPPGMPAGPYEPRLIVTREGAGQLPAFVDGEPTGVSLPLGEVRLTSEGRHVQPVDPEAPSFGPDLRLLTASLPHEPLRPGGEVRVRATWQATQSPSKEYTAHLSLVGSGEEVVARHRLPLAYHYPVTEWQRGEVVRATYVLPLESLDPGSYGVRLSVAGEESHLGEMEIAGSPRIFDLPSEAQPLNAAVGEAIALRGYDLPQGQIRAPGETLRVRLFWQAVTKVPGDYKVFVHLVDGEGVLRAQDDSVPGEWQRPTRGWAEGEVVVDAHALEVPEEAPPGVYTLYAGMYDADTLQRLPITMEGELLPDDRLPVTEVRIEP